MSSCVSVAVSARKKVLEIGFPTSNVDIFYLNPIFQEGSTCSARRVMPFRIPTSTFLPVSVVNSKVPFPSSKISLNFGLMRSHSSSFSEYSWVLISSLIISYSSVSLFFDSKLVVHVIGCFAVVTDDDGGVVNADISVYAVYVDESEFCVALFVSFIQSCLHQRPHIRCYLKLVRADYYFNHDYFPSLLVVVDGRAVGLPPETVSLSLSHPTRSLAGWFAPLLRLVVVGWCWGSSNCPNTVHSLGGCGCALLFGAHTASWFLFVCFVLRTLL